MPLGGGGRIGLKFFQPAAIRSYFSSRYFLTQQELLPPKNNFSTSGATGMQKLLDLNGQAVNYEQVGNGPKTLLCLPGALGKFSCSSQLFRKLIVIICSNEIDFWNSKV